MKNICEYVVIGIGLLLIVVSIKIAIQDDVLTTKDIVAIVIGFGLGIPITLGSVFIIRKKEVGINNGV